LLSGNCLFLLRGISISDEMPGPWRLINPCRPCGGIIISISDEMPGPWRRVTLPFHPLRYSPFQSQTRCQAPGDISFARSVAALKCYFNLRRDARPLATGIWVSCHEYHEEFQSQTRCQAPGDLHDQSVSPRRRSISISDEMPGPWRHGIYATVRSYTSWISISDEMPGPWRHIKRVLMAEKVYQFQSQTRCQAPGDCDANNPLVLAHYISISDEMPGPWRLPL